MKKINLQMYSFADGMMEDYRVNIRKAAEMGYDGVELFGPCMDIPVDEMGSLLKELKLDAISLHESTNRIEERLPYASALGMKFIGIGMEVLKCEEDVHQYAIRLNQLGEMCKKQGLILTYHNHTQEFGEFNDKRIYDILMQETNPEYVSFELDAGWCAAAGVDPIEIVRKYSGRIKLIHLKESNEAIGPQPPMDFANLEVDAKGRPIFTEEVIKMFERSKRINCAAGEGLVDWKQLMEVADDHGCEAYIVERERTYQNSRLDCLQSDLTYYKSL